MYRNLHGFSGEGVDDLCTVKVQLPISILSEELAATVAQQFVVGDLKFKGTGIPRVV